MSYFQDCSKQVLKRIWEEIGFLDSSISAAGALTDDFQANVLVTLQNSTAAEKEAEPHAFK